MQSRFTATGVTTDDRHVILAYQLNEEAFQVNLQIIPRKSLNAEQTEALEKTWVEGGVFEFPADTIEVLPNLNAETILPDDIRSDETGKIRGKQNEWAYQLLTGKLWESYLQELDELKKKAEGLTQYDRQLFDDAKSFWERVLEHRKERDISQERLDKIKDDVNSVFEKLKTFKKTESAEFETASAKARDEALVKLEDLRKRADEKANFKALLEELKTQQQDSRKNRYSKADDVQMRKAYDSAYQYINEQRNHFFSDKTAIRIKGLNEVIQKMEQSLNRDKRDLEYLQKKTNSPMIKSLELQLIKVKGNLLNEAIASKEEKLKDIYSTLEKLQKQSSRGGNKQTESTDKPVAEVTSEVDTANAEVKEETTTIPVMDSTAAQQALETDETNPSSAE